MQNLLQRNVMFVPQHCQYNEIPLRTGVLRGMVLLGNCMPLVRRYVGLFAVWLVFLESCEDKHFA